MSDYITIYGCTIAAAASAYWAALKLYQSRFGPRPAVTADHQTEATKNITTKNDRAEHAPTQQIVIAEERKEVTPNSSAHILEMHDPTAISRTSSDLRKEAMRMFNEVSEYFLYVEKCASEQFGVEAKGLDITYNSGLDSKPLNRQRSLSSVVGNKDVKSGHRARILSSTRNYQTPLPSRENSCERTKLSRKQSAKIKYPYLFKRIHLRKNSSVDMTNMLQSESPTKRCASVDRPTLQKAAQFPHQPSSSGAVNTCGKAMSLETKNIQTIPNTVQTTSSPGTDKAKSHAPRSQQIVKPISSEIRGKNVERPHKHRPRDLTPRPSDKGPDKDAVFDRSKSFQMRMAYRTSLCKRDASCSKVIQPQKAAGSLKTK